jgi:hypothetical protein
MLPFVNERCRCELHENKTHDDGINVGSSLKRNNAERSMVLN